MCGLTPSEPYRYTAYQNPQCTRDRGILHGSSGTRDLTFNFTRLSSKATCVLSTLISRCGAKTQVPTRDASAPRRTRRQRFHMHYHRTVCSSSHVPTSAAQQHQSSHLHRSMHLATQRQARPSLSGALCHRARALFSAGMHDGMLLSTLPGPWPPLLCFASLALGRGAMHVS